MGTIVLLVACVHRVDLTSNPPGAAVMRGDERVGSTPMQLELRPFQKRKLTFRYPGYRKVTTKVRPGTTSFVFDALTGHWQRMVGARVYASVEVRLVEEHGGVGTWDPEDVK